MGRTAPRGSSLVEADLTVAPFYTATTTLEALPPQVTPEGVTGYPNNEVETGDTPSSGDSNVYAIFYVETNPVYAEQPVEIASPQLEARCIQGWRWEPEGGVVVFGTGVNQNPPQSTLDDDGNAVFVFKEASCAAGRLRRHGRRRVGSTPDLHHDLHGGSPRSHDLSSFPVPASGTEKNPSSAAPHIAERAIRISRAPPSNDHIPSRRSPQPGALASRLVPGPAPGPAPA